MNGDASGKNGPDTLAMPCASSTVMPVSAITTAIATMASTLSVVAPHWSYVNLTAPETSPGRHRFVATYTAALTAVAMRMRGAGCASSRMAA